MTAAHCGQHSPKRTHRRFGRESGAVLVVALVMLLLLTLIGVTAMRSTTLDEKMSGNLRDQDVALQSAEAGLRDAEVFVSGLVNTGGFTNANGLFTQNNAPDPFAPATWASGSSNARAYSGTLTGLPAPRYFIEERGVIEQKTGASINLMNYGETTGMGAVNAFRIVAHGVGRSGSTQVVLEEHYGKQF